MSDVTDAVKRYWPWVLGGVVILWLFSRTGSSSAGSGDYWTAMAQGNAAAQAAAQQGAQIAAQQDYQNRALAMQERAQDRQYDLATLQITTEFDATRYITDAQTTISTAQLALNETIAGYDYDLGRLAINVQDTYQQGLLQNEALRITTESQTALGVAGIQAGAMTAMARYELEGVKYGWDIQENIATKQSLAQMSIAQTQAGVMALHGYADIMNAMYAPGIASINAAAYENAAAMQAAATIVAAGYQAQSGVAQTGFATQGMLGSSAINIVPDSLFSISIPTFNPTGIAANAVANQRTTDLSGGWGPFYGAASF